MSRSFIIHDVEQGSDAWKKIRLAKITATRLKKVMSANYMDLIDDIIAETVAQEIDEDGYKSIPMQRGDDYEPLARVEYMKRTGADVKEYGFITSGRKAWLGYSPDGLISLPDNKYKGIEIKCPDTSTHVRSIRQNKVPNEYKYQALCAFLVIPEMDSLDFLSFDTRFYPKTLHIVTITREEILPEINKIEEELNKFWAKFEEYYQQVIF